MAEHELPTRHALVVDDGPVERLAGKTMLEKLGYFVMTAASGEEALQFLSERTVDLVLCDISMPGMGGLTLLETVRSQPSAPPFIMSTSHNDAEHAVASLRRGAYGYLTKPLRIDALRYTVEEAISKYQDEKEAAREAEALARHDPLTNLMNKGEFSRRLAQRMRTVSTDGSRSALLLLKVQGLNHINHTYGRREGDRVLQTTAKALNNLIRPSDMLGRFGGDLFSLYLDGIAHSQVEERAIGIGEAIEEIKLVLAEDAISLSLSIGGACSHMAMGTEDLLNRADFALHLARERSRNRIRIYSEGDEIHKRELSHQLSTLGTVRAALADQKRRVIMHYQPIIDLASGKVSHFEALLRLQDDQGRPCNPGELVKTCEVFGLIGRLDHAVVNACLSAVARLPDDTGMAINLSGKSIGDPDLLQFIEARIAALEIDPSRIIFELTETAAFYNLDEVRHFVRRIKHLGCRFALDDFGVGFSSFYYIKELDFDYLKLDGSFIANLPRNPNDQVFVRAMVEISRVFGLTVIAEWVEDRETAEMLRGFGVAFGQGYYFGKALPLPATP